jgi:pimeloyl-ACP methyl ester carboxylesterase
MACCIALLGAYRLGPISGCSTCGGGASQYLERDGVKLAYQLSGHGTPPVMLVPGWCDNHTTLAVMAAYFSARHHVVKVDLRGHRQSDKPESDYSIASFADDMAWLCAQLGLHRPIIIEHSLGGAIALELATCYPGVPAAIIALEGIILFPAEVRAGGQLLVEALHTPAWREAMHGYIDAGFMPIDDPELQWKAHEELDRLPQYMHASVAAQSLLWDAAAAARACRVPVLYIEAGSGLSDLDHFKALCPQLVVGKTVYVGHNQRVARPEQATAMIDRFIAVELRSARDAAV